MSHEYPLQHSISKTKAYFLYTLVSLFLFFEMGVQVSPSVMANQLMQDLNITTFGLGLMSGVYFYTYTVMQIPSGVLLDKFSPRFIITAAILMCSIGIGLFGFASNIYVASTARLLMGFGSAFAFISVLVVTADLFPAKYFATLTGVTQMLAALGAMCGQLPISMLVNNIGWRHTVFILAIIGFVLAIIVWCVLKYEKVGASDKLNIINENGGMAKLFKNPQTWIIAIYACLLWAPMSGFASLWGVPYLAAAHNLPTSLAALLCSLMWIGLAIASPLLGYYATFIGNKVQGLYLSALCGLIAFALLLLFNLPIWLMAICIFVAGAACAGQALSFTLVKEGNSNANKGTAISVNNMAVVISGAIFQPLIGKLIQVFSPVGGSPTAAAYHNALFVILGVYMLGFVVARLFIKEPANLYHSQKA